MVHRSPWKANNHSISPKTKDLQMQICRHVSLNDTQKVVIKKKQTILNIFLDIIYSWRSLKIILLFIYIALFPKCIRSSKIEEPMAWRPRPGRGAHFDQAGAGAQGAIFENKKITLKRILFSRFLDL